MKVNKVYLERKISALNQWLEDNPNHHMHRLKTNNRDYYVKKLIELEENELSTIKV